MSKVIQQSITRNNWISRWQIEEADEEEEVKLWRLS